jgi:quinol monooxygenase YgiN
MIMSGSGEHNQAMQQMAKYQIRPEALERCLRAIHEFVAYVRANESGTLHYDVWQERGDTTRFVHIFTFRDDEAERIHSESPAVKKFTGVLYPECIAPVEFTAYRLLDSKTKPRV